jgi:hypothetical protein
LAEPLSGDSPQLNHLRLSSGPAMPQKYLEQPR